MKWVLVSVVIVILLIIYSSVVFRRGVKKGNKQTEKDILSFVERLEGLKRKAEDVFVVKTKKFRILFGISSPRPRKTRSVLRSLRLGRRKR